MCMDKFVIFTYNISKLKQNDKMRFIRKLRGYDSIRAGKIERKNGLLHDVNGFKFGVNTIIVPLGNREKIAGLFKDFKINTKSLVVRL